MSNCLLRVDLFRMTHNLFRYKMCAFSLLHSENKQVIIPAGLFVLLTYGRLRLCKEQGKQYANNEDDI